MASLEENLAYWEKTYDWSGSGEEWSQGWGGSERLWMGSIRPRLARFLPTESLLEIAPGFGRFTPYLLKECTRYEGIDLAPRCVHACRKRFPQAHFLLGDGKSLEGVATDSIDFVFSFFSLIHAELDVIQAYLQELTRVLKPTGAAFLHHSNLAEHSRYFHRIERLPAWLKRGLFAVGCIDLPQWRALSVSATLVAKVALDVGLAVVSQEVVPFGSRRGIDCFSTFVKADGTWKAQAIRWDHPAFIQEAWRVRQATPFAPAYLPSHVYGPLERR